MSLVKLLLVDDVDANLLALEQLLEAPDRQLIRASSGEEALEILLQQQDFAVILMDVQMPGLDGFATVSLLKAKESCQSIPIIFLTAFDKEGAMEVEAYASGAVDYVMKPIQPPVIIGKVDVFVRLYQAQQKLSIYNDKLQHANLKLTREISLRERAEGQLRLADQAIHDTHESVVISDAEGIIRRVNPAFCQLFGHSDDALLGQPISTFIARSNLSTDYALIIAALQHEGKWQGELQYNNNDQAASDQTVSDQVTSTASVWGHISGIYNKQQGLTHYCGIFSAINDPQKTEMALRKVKLRLEQAQHLSHLGGWEWNRSETGIYCSDELFAIINSSPELTPASIALCQQLVHPDDREKFEHVLESLKNGHSTDSVLRLLLPGGQERIVHEQTEVHCNAKGEILQLIGTVHDITEHAQLEENFMQVQKMEAVGAMVGGIAHEFNNILAGMNGHMYLAKSHSQDNPQALKHIGQLETLSARAAATIHQMLTFSRKGIINMHSLRLNSLLNETLKLHRTSVPEHISLSQQICTDNLSVHGDITLLQQLTLNLIINARDALIGITDPAIHLRLQIFEADESFLQQHDQARPGSYAQLTVSDNGCGIEADKLDKIFEPFFSSKGEHGTGLGLSMVYGAVKSHHGLIAVDSQPGKGSNFHVYLPLLRDNTQTTDTSTQSKLVKGSGQSILIADDEEIVRDMTRDTLEMLGYKVICAANGQQAVKLFTQQQDSIDLVILDVVMPKLGGADAAAAIRNIHQHANIIFITGYNDEKALGTWVSAHEVIIKKPFSIEAFSQIVAKQINQPNPV